MQRTPRSAPRIVLLPLHAGLTTEEQLAVFEPAERGTRKVIVSTNIAEVCKLEFPMPIISRLRRPVSLSKALSLSWIVDLSR